MVKLDETDRRILHHLIENAKMPSKELARVLKIHPNTLLQRIKKLEKNKVIKKYMAVVDYDKIGMDMYAVVMIRIKKRGLENPKLLATVTAIPQVEALYAVTGGQDCIAIVRAAGKESLVETLGKIQSDENILRTTTHLILLTYKPPYEFNPM